MVIFHSYVSLPEGTSDNVNGSDWSGYLAKRTRMMVQYKILGVSYVRIKPNVEVEVLKQGAPYPMVN